MTKDKYVFKKIFVGCDHAGLDAKKKVCEVLNNFDLEFEDMGTFSSISVDYPDYAVCVSKMVLKTPNSCGILICGSGTGMQIAANKIDNIRAVFCFDEYSSKMSRLDNNCNILTLRAREFDINNYENIIKTFISTEFSNLKRHIVRLEKISQIEKNN